MSVLLLGLLLLVALAIFFVLLGGLTSGSGADLLDWDPSGRAEARASIEQEDFEDMLELNNRYRRARGLAEVGEEDIRRGEL